MTYLNKNTLVSFSLGLFLSAGLVYAAQNITTLLQTAAPGDKVTSTWVNAVNTKFGTIDAAGGGSSFTLRCSHVGWGGSVYNWVWTPGCPAAPSGYTRICGTPYSPITDNQCIGTSGVYSAPTVPGSTCAGECAYFK